MAFRVSESHPNSLSMRFLVKSIICKGKYLLKERSVSL